MPDGRIPWRPLFLAWRDTTIALVLAVLVSVPFVMLGMWNKVEDALQPGTVATCTAWELNADSVDSPEAARALALGETVPNADSWELIEEDGSLWVEGCFPEGVSGQDFAKALEAEGLFAGKINIEFLDLREKLTPILVESLDTYLLPVALATPLAFGLTALFFIRRRGLEVRPRTSTGGAILLGVGTALGGYVVVLAAERLLAAVGLHQQEQPWILSIVEQGGSLLIGLAVFAILIGPFGEEIFFRRFLFESLDRSAGRVWAYGASTLVFALVHFNPAALPSYCLIGLILAAVYERSRSLTAAWVAHGCFNALSLAQLTLLR